MDEGLWLRLWLRGEKVSMGNVYFMLELVAVDRDINLEAIVVQDGDYESK